MTASGRWSRVVVLTRARRFSSAKPPVEGPPVDTFVADAPAGAAPVTSFPEPRVDLDKPSFR
jgi:hypothetical protein